MYVVANSRVFFRSASPKTFFCDEKATQLFALGRNEIIQRFPGVVAPRRVIE